MVYLAASSVDVTNQKVDNITSQSVAEYEITFKLTLINPSSTDIDIERLTYQAYLEDEFIGEGEKSDFTIESGETDHTFKFTFNIYDLAGSVRTLFITSTATLKITGDVTIPVKLFGQWKVASVTVQYEYNEEISA
jgi:LEA14-like dessication related protein